MKNPISADNYFKDFDFENAPIIKHPMIKQLQENQRQFDKISPKNLTLSNGEKNFSNEET